MGKQEDIKMGDIVMVMRGPFTGTTGQVRMFNRKEICIDSHKNRTGMFVTSIEFVTKI